MRRRRLARLIPEEDRAAFDRDGFIIKRDFLPPEIFAGLVDQVRGLRAPAREMVEGDTITRHIALDPAVLERVPAARRLLDTPEYRNLIRYGGASAAAPMVYLQTILSGMSSPARPTRRRDLHTDTFHPTVKAWLFLTDVAGRCDAVRLRAGIAPPDAAAARLGAADGDRGQPSAGRGPQPARATAGPRDRRTDSSPSSACRRRARSRSRPTPWSSPTRSAFMPAAPSAAADRRVSRSGRSGGATRSCRGPGSTRGRSRRSDCASRSSTGNRWICSERSVSGGSAGAPAATCRPSTRPIPAICRTDTRKPDDALFSQQRRGAVADRPTPRSFLFLQGPISNFFDRLGRALIARGHKRAPDQPAFRRPAVLAVCRRPISAAGFDDWRAFIAECPRPASDHRPRSCIGDRRPYHIDRGRGGAGRGASR